MEKNQSQKDKEVQDANSNTCILWFSVSMIHLARTRDKEEMTSNSIQGAKASCDVHWTLVQVNQTDPP